MATQSIPPVLGAATRALLTKLGPVLKQTIDGAKPTDVIEAGISVNNVLVMTQIGTAEDVRKALSEMRML